MERDGYEKFQELYSEVYSPTNIAGVPVDDAMLKTTFFYHYFIGSTPPDDCPLLDLPGEQSLMTYAKRK